MNIEHVKKILASGIAQSGSQERYAAMIGVTQSYISKILNGDREPGKEVLDALGLEKIVSVLYKKKG